MIKRADLAGPARHAPRRRTPGSSAGGPRRLAAVFTTGMALCALMPAGPGLTVRAAVPEAEIRAAVAAELSSRHYQRELAIEEPEASPQVAADLAPDLLEVVGWIAIVAIAAVALVWLWRFLADRRRAAAPAGVEAGAPPAGTARRRTLDDYLAEADRLAREGRHGAAAHHLLAGTLFGFSGIDAAAAAPFLTAREVVARAPLGDVAKPALRQLVACVERARFAGRAVDEVDFARCRRNFLALADALMAGAAA
jgi:hypothetical protein